MENVFIGDWASRHPARSFRVAVKDNIDVAGYITTVGTKTFADNAPAQCDAAVIANFRKDSHAVIIGKTNMDELAAGATGVNPWFGAVDNPSAPGHISGGSSSGSAAAVALDLADVALGTDTGGSVRIPSALCGTYGLKTTIGSISTRGVAPLSQSLDTVGLLAADAAQLGRGYALATQRVGSEASTARVTRVGRLRFSEPENSIDECIDAALGRWHGTDIVDILLPHWLEAHSYAFTILSFEAWNNWRSVAESSPEDIGSDAMAVLTAGSGVSVEQYSEALRFRVFWTQSINNVLRDSDVLVCPVVSTPPPLIHRAGEIDWSSFSRTMQFNLSGHPAISVPVGMDSQRMPVGMQVVGNMGYDRQLIDIAFMAQSFWRRTS